MLVLSSPVPRRRTEDAESGGTLQYSAARIQLNIDDRELAHLRLLTASKLRRNEPFMLSWSEPAESGGGRGSIWVHPASDLFFRFSGSRSVEIDRDVLEKTSVEAMSPGGLHITARLER